MIGNPLKGGVRDDAVERLRATPTPKIGFDEEETTIRLAAASPLQHLG
jgi:hypothetical protein